MCYDSADDFDGNKVLVCQVGDLKPGDRYRTPDEPGVSLGVSLMVLDLPAVEGFSMVTDTNGRVSSVPNSTKLGRDRCGRLYASRYLNPTDATPDALPVILPDPQPPTN
jgi:hypothetical protein